MEQVKAAGEEAGKVTHMGLIVFLWIFGLAAWTLLQLFATPWLQKKTFLPAITGFLHFETGWGAFTVIGYFAFALLLILALVQRFSPPADVTEENLKALNILLLILAILSLAGAVETFLSYKYLSEDKIGRRSLYAPFGKTYGWDEVREIKVDLTVHNTGSNKSERVSYLKWNLVLSDGAKVPVENAIRGDFAQMKRIYAHLPENTVFDLGGRNEEYWAYLQQSVFNLQP